jgi:hypothetical protein
MSVEFSLRALAVALACCIAAPAWSDPASPAPDARAALDQAIQHEQSRRSGAITGVIVGGVIVVAGSVASAVSSVQNQDDKDNGRPASHNRYIGYAVGLGVGLPIMAISGWIWSDAQHKLNQLHRERVSVSYSPDTHQPVLQLSFSY